MPDIENDWKYRNDTGELRDALCEYLETRFGKIRFLEEKLIGKVRADIIAVLPDGICGIEIKSHSDSYTRLASQIKGYDKYCNYNYLCAGSVHIKAGEHVPAYWGVISASVREGVSFGIIREPELNPKCSLKCQLSLLWRNELGYILRKNKLPAYKQKSKKFICEKLIEKLDEKILREQLCDRLFERDYTKYADESELRSR